MKRWAGISAGVALVIAAGVALYLSGGVFRRHAPGPGAPDDAVTAFLAAHWPDPLPAQGAPPPQFTPLEASLAPEACGQCHTEQYRDWRDSLHSRAVGPGILWQFRLMDQRAANACLRCHAPLAEQKALMALEHGWSAAPSTAPPAYVSAELHRQGLVCAACHVRAHTRFGPPARVASPTPLPHAGFRADPAFADSRFCAVCHQFSESGTRLNGKLLENTYEEWRTSRASAAGQACQSCHMPERRHLWRGIHDPQMTAAALTSSLEVSALGAGRLRAQSRITNSGAGHHFPTYVVPEVVLTLELVDPRGRRGHVIARGVIARRANIELTQELSDTRMASDESRVLAGEFARPAEAGWHVELRMAVHPGAHYERTFRHALARADGIKGETRRLLRDALARIEAGRYEVTLARRRLE
jgi:hypothetical protein